MANLSIKSKLLVMLLAVSLFSIAVVASLNYYTCYQTLKGAMFSHLTSVRASRADQIEQNFARLRMETIALAASNAVVDASPAVHRRVPQARERAGRARDGRRAAPVLSADVRAGSSKRTPERTVEIDSLLPETPPARYLQYYYAAKNPFPIARKGRHAARRRRVRLQPRARDVSSRRCGA